MIGILDSGQGGLFLLHKLYQRFPKQDFVCLMDKAHFPYGEKSPNVLRSLLRKNINFLTQQGVKEVIVACNTASVVLEKPSAYPVPVKEIISASLKQAYQYSQNKKVGVLATKGTVESKAFLIKSKKLNQDLHIYQQACPSLAPFVEQFGPLSQEGVAPTTERGVAPTTKRGVAPTTVPMDTSKEKAIPLLDDSLYTIQNKKLLPLLNKYLKPLVTKGVDTVILGCTHYLYLQKAVEEHLGKEKKVAGPVPFLIKDMLKSPLNKKARKETGKITLFIHNREKQFKNTNHVKNILID